MLDTASISLSRRRTALATRNPHEPFSRISVQEAKAKLDDGSAVLVDVREPGEYAKVHADGARLIPVNTVVNEVQQIRDYANGKEVLFICKSSTRSALAAEFALAGGLSGLELSNVEGGTLAWVEAGLPIVGPPPPTTRIKRPVGIAV